MSWDAESAPNLVTFLRLGRAGWHTITWQPYFACASCCAYTHNCGQQAFCRHCPDGEYSQIMMKKKAHLAASSCFHVEVFFCWENTDSGITAETVCAWQFLHVSAQGSCSRTVTTGWAMQVHLMVLASCQSTATLHSTLNNGAITVITVKNEKKKCDEAHKAGHTGSFCLSSVSV